MVMFKLLGCVSLTLDLVRTQTLEVTCDVGVLHSPRITIDNIVTCKLASS